MTKADGQKNADRGYPLTECYTYTIMRNLVVVLALLAWLEPLPVAEGRSEQAPHGDTAQSGKAKEAQPAPPTLLPQKSSARPPVLSQWQRRKHPAAQLGR